MKSHQKYLLPSLALAAFVPHAWAEKDVVIRRLDVETPRVVVRHEHDDAKVEKEKVTYLGVETAPVNRTLSAQLGLPRDTGLIVTNVLEKSPAAEVLKEDDVLIRLDDQLLVNTQQLGVLVRGKKDGDEIKLTLMRGGKELTVKAKLTVHEVPRMADTFFLRNGGPGGGDWQGFLPPDALAGLERLHDLPGMGPDEARDVLRMIGRARAHGGLLNGPGVHILGRKGKGSTILDLPKSNISYSDDEGSIEIKSNDTQRSLTVRNAKGEVAFSGPINTEEERDKLPAEVKQRLEKLDSDTFDFEVGKDFKPETVPLPPEPAKTKINRALGQTARPGLRPL
ncbi:MAG: PDZ domain-containing protein [bacterium]|nr:PDZ domain-containing protein [bacterium]MDI1334806.1 PDZ domain-containing protein [Lacunisphaera sp.]